MNFRNGAIPHMLQNVIGYLHLHHLHTHGHIIYLWKAFSTPETMKYTVDAKLQMMSYTCSESQTWSSSTNLHSKLRHFIIMNGCYVFVSVFNATSYAIGIILMDCLIEVHLCETNWTRSPSMSLPFVLHLTPFLCFTKYSFITNVSRFGEATRDILFILFYSL